MSSKSPFIESIRRTMRLRGYSIRTEKVIFIGYGFIFAFISIDIQKKWDGMR